MLPLYLVTEHGMSLDWANSLVGTSRISTLGMAFLGGWATDRCGPKPVMIGAFFVTGILTLLIGMVSTPWIAAIVFLQPMLAVCFYPAGFAALSTISTPEAKKSQNTTESKVAEPVPVAPKPKRSVTINPAEIMAASGNGFIETEEQVEQYIEQLREQLLKAIKASDKVRIK